MMADFKRRTLQLSRASKLKYLAIA